MDALNPLRMTSGHQYTLPPIQSDSKSSIDFWQIKNTAGSNLKQTHFSKCLQPLGLMLFR